jgi:hypothetical protein
MNQSTLRGKGSRARNAGKNQAETCTSGGRKTRSSRHVSLDQDIAQKDVSTGSSARVGRKTNARSITETRPSTCTRQSGRVNVNKEQRRNVRNEEKQQKTLTRYFHSVPSQSDKTLSKLKNRSRGSQSGSSSHGNEIGEVQPLKTGISLTRGGKKENITKTAAEKMDKDMDGEKMGNGKENQMVPALPKGRRGRPRATDKITKESDHSEEGGTQNTSIKESPKENSESHTLEAVPSSSSPGQGILRTPKKRGTSANTEEVSSPYGSTDVKIKTPVLSRSKANSPKTPTVRSLPNSPVQGVRITPRGKLATSEVLSPDGRADFIRIKTPVLSRSKANSPKTPTKTTGNQPVGRLLGSPGDSSLSVSRSSSAVSSPVVRRLGSFKYADRYSEGCSGIQVR